MVKTTAGWRILAVLALYAAYLPFSGYTPGQFAFDAAEYWELSLKFTQHGKFSLLAYDEPLRGYLGPLLVLPARIICHFTGWPMLAGARILGAGWAAILFGVAIPQLWRQTTGRGLRGGRWLVLVGLSFIFWRDYFNFTLSDMPALTLLVLGLMSLGRGGWKWVAAAGLLIGAAINIRPIYAACLPGALWLLALSLSAGQGHRVWLRGAGFVLGAALALLPQWRINQLHFQRNTPLVLGALPGARPLYLKQLTWGTGFQRYESSLIPGRPRSLVYADPAGQQVVAQEPTGRFASYSDYLRAAAGSPFATSWRYVRHLFNGLDIRYPTPYPRQLQPPGQAMLRLLNYALLGLGLGLAGAASGRFRGKGSPPSLPPSCLPVLLALLLPCLLVLPTLMECRFLLPLHLLLLTGIAATWRPVAGWQALGSPGRRAVVLALGLLWVWGCWHLSEDTARQLRPASEAPQD